MPVQRNDKEYSAVAQLLAASDIQSSWIRKYIENYLQTGGDINFQISDDSVLGFTKPELLGCTLLHLAYKQHKLDLFNLLLIHGADYTIKNSRGSTVLHQIIEDTYEREVESFELEPISDNPFVNSILDALAQSGNSYSDSNKKGLTNFHIACMANHKPAVVLFLTTGQLYNQSVFKDSPIFPGYTALHFAARFSNLEIVKILLECGAIHNIMDAKEMTPLQVLIEQNIRIADLLNKNELMDAASLTTMRKTKEDIICLLLSKSTRPTDYVIDHNTNLSRLHIACIVESLPITVDLLGNARKINQAVSWKSSPFQANTALHFAALCNLEKVKLLLQKGANINLRNAKGQTAFDLCMERYEVKDICDIIACVSNWCKVELSLPGKTLLDLASYMRDFHAFAVRVMSELGHSLVDKNSKLWPSYSLLHVAVTLSERGCKNDQMMIKEFANPDKWLCLVTKRAVNPLHLAFRQKKPKVVNSLLTSSSNIYNRVDTDKLSHLHIACAAGVTSAVEKLLLAGANVNLAVRTSFEWFSHPESNSDAPREVYIPKGSTSLHVAVIVGHCETMKLLLARGADVYAKDDHGMTPIHWLMASDNPISPAADILLSTSRPVSTTSSTNGNKRFATSSTIKDCVTNTGLSHLHVACLSNNVVAVEQLLRQGSVINAVSYRAADDDTKRFPGRVRYAGYTPLHFALEGKGEETVKLLIQLGAQVMTKNVVKNTIPLYEALTDEQSSCAGVLREFFKSNKVLQKQLEKDLGLIMLHFYCCVIDVEAVQNLLMNEGTNCVNSSLFWSSPIWPGYTPLHVLMKYYQTSSQEANILLKLLLNYGADVTLANAEKNTPVHMAYDLDLETSCKAPLIQSMLRSQKNFNINTQHYKGLSHFHIACTIVDVVTIEKYLKLSTDVNQSVDYFFQNQDDIAINGCTPLHLLLFPSLNENVEVTTRLTIRAVATLIQNGADVSAENVFGNTPLHLAAKYYPQCIDLLKTIADGGGNMYAKNIFGQTPLELMLNSKDVTIEGVKFFLYRGYRANTFNPITQKGFVAMTFSTHSYSIFQQQKPVFDIMMEACCYMSDETGRTVMHNVVSTSTPIISDKFYTKMFESLIKIVDIDHQDKLGRTALHVATQFKNHGAIFALLQAGADINIVDAENKTAFAYAFETLPFYEGSQDNSETIVRIFSSHVQKLNVCVLDVHEMNHSALIDAFKQYDVDGMVNQSFYEELKEMKNVQVASSSLTLQHIISGTNTESVSLCISELSDNLINNLFETIDKNRFCETLGIIRLQCRKIARKIVITERNLISSHCRISVVRNSFLFSQP